MIAYRHRTVERPRQDGSQTEFASHGKSASMPDRFCSRLSLPMTDTPSPKRDWFSGRVSNVLFYKVALLNARFSRIIALEAGKGGLTLLQFKVLSAIGSFAPVPAAKICEFLTIDQAVISRTVRQLLDLGLITRTLSAKDGRMVELDLSTTGKDAYGRIAAEIDAHQKRVLAPFDEHQQKALFAMIDTLLEMPGL
jgi:DNA-binding MarR family transcriptional regulator